MKNKIICELRNASYLSSTYIAMQRMLGNRSFVASCVLLFSGYHL